MRRAWLVAAVVLAPTIPAQALAPGDVLRDEQYALDMVEAPDAWATATGEGVEVAVVDTGTDLTHADLVNRTAVVEGTSVAEPTGTYARLPAGPWNTTQDTDGHGTLVAGMVAAERDNAVGIAGPSRATIVPIKTDDVGVLATADLVAEGIQAAVEAEVDAIQVSQVVPENVGGLGNALAEAEAAGIPVVAAAGNTGEPEPAWPAAAGTAIAVGAVDETASPWSESNGGVDVVAPGVDVLSTGLGNRYAQATGTSLAAPIVAASLAIALDACPALEPVELRRLVNATAADLRQPGWGARTGWGLVQADELAARAAGRCA